MEAKSVQLEMQTAVRTDLGAIFVSLELSRSTWLITSLSPGNGEKMSKHVVDGGNITELLARFEQLQQKAWLRTGKSFPIVTIQEAGLDGFWIHRILEANGIESYIVVNRPRFLDQLRLEFSGSIQGGALVEPPDFISEIGTLLPIAPCGRNSL